MTRKVHRQRREIFLRQWREHRGLSLQQLAAATESTHATLSRLERGLIPYGQDLLERLADALETEPAFILSVRL
jgi:transcriptional regulator with XRE-family HTH domain